MLNPTPKRRLLAPILLALGGAFGVAAAVLADGSASRIDFALVGPVLVLGLFSILMALRELARSDSRNPESEVFVGSSPRLLVLVPATILLVQPLLLTPYDPALTALILHAGIALVAAAVAFGPRGLPRILPRALELVLATALLLFLGGELSLRVLASQRPGPTFVQADETGASRLTKIRRPGLVRFGTATNDDGAFDEPFTAPSDPGASPGGTMDTVLLLGDETTLGAVPTCMTPSAHAERELDDVRIWDHSLHGASPLEQLAILEEWERDGRLKSIQGVVFTVSNSDDWFQCRRREDAFRFLALWLDSENALLPTFARRVTSPDRRRLILEGELGGPTAEPTLDQVAERYPMVFDPSAAQPPISTEQFRNRTREDARRTSIACNDEGVERMLRLLDRAERLCGAHGLGFAVLVLPHRAELDDGFSESVDIDPRIWSRPRNELVERLRKRGTKVTDATEVLRLRAQRLEGGGGALFHPIDIRLSRYGTKPVGEVLIPLVRSVIVD